MLDAGASWSRRSTASTLLLNFLVLVSISLLLSPSLAVSSNSRNRRPLSSKGGKLGSTSVTESSDEIVIPMPNSGPKQPVVSTCYFSFYLSNSSIQCTCNCILFFSTINIFALQLRFLQMKDILVSIFFSSHNNFLFLKSDMFIRPVGLDTRRLTRNMSYC